MFHVAKHSSSFENRACSFKLDMFRNYVYLFSALFESRALNSTDHQHVKKPALSDIVNMFRKRTTDIYFNKFKVKHFINSLVCPGMALTINIYMLFEKWLSNILSI
jgi:hypothetical protein